ncbi:little elongation complex subunit 1 [Drosophila rhopaloa]|uniref:Little elongation complex subunit 1 n=1 Tax=Drosophila rhopaloa TaxID=1041015 RepID=A0ABM5I0F3_DRORH|nr:little elongation complex subunit 1 [Drosophila rhopaloa]
MDLSEFSDINIDHLLGSTAPLQDGLVVPYRQVPLPKINDDIRTRRIRLAQRIAQNDELIRQIKQLQVQNKKLVDLQRTAQEVTDLYQKEKQQRTELEKSCRQISERCGELEKELDAQVLNCENLQEKLQVRGLPVDAKDVLSLIMQLAQRLGDDCGLLRRDQNILKKLKEHCKAVDIVLPTPKSPNQRSKRKSHQPGVNQSTQTDVEPVITKPLLCSVAVQVENLIETRNQGTQHKNTTTTRGTTTASFIRQHDVGTCFPEPKSLPNVRQILDEMLSWRDNIVIEPMSTLSDPQAEWEDIPTTASVTTCTTLCDIHREIDFVSELPSQIKVSASRPPSRTMLDSVKEEARSSRELAKELLNFLPQNQSCLANLPPHAFEELWQVFGQMVLGLLQRRSNPTVATPPTVSQADFTSWLYELYEGTQNQTEQISSSSASKRDFATSTDCMDVGTDPIIESPNISHGGDVTPIRLPSKPRGRKTKSKKRKAATIPNPTPKRNCFEKEPACQEKNIESEEIEHEQKPETAIQFLSKLNNFNMANCDNLDMDLDEEELYLLQLTSNAKDQVNDNENLEDEVPEDFESPAENAEFLLQENKEKQPITPVHKEKDLSLKDDDQNNASIELLHIQDKTKELLPKKQLDSEVNIFKEPEIESEKKEKIIKLSQVATNGAIPSNLSTFSSNSAVKSNVREEKCSEEMLDLELSTCEVREKKAEVPNGTERLNSPLLSRDSNPDNSIRKNVEKDNVLKFKSCNDPESQLNQEDILPSLNTSLFGSDSDLESEVSEEQMNPEFCVSDNDSDDIKAECEISHDQPDFKKRSISSLFGSDSDSDVNEEHALKLELDQKVLRNEPDKLNLFNLPLLQDDTDSSAAEESLSKEQADKKNESEVSQEHMVLSHCLPSLAHADLVAIKPPLLIENFGVVVNEHQLPKEQTSSKATSNLSDESEDEQSLVIDEETSVKQPEESPFPRPVPTKRRKVQNEIKTLSPTGVTRLTRQRAKQLLNEGSAGNGLSLVEQIRNQLKEALTKSESSKNTKLEFKPVESNRLMAEEAHTELKPIKQTNTISEESPASPVSEPTEDFFDPPTKIPLEQAACRQQDGKPKSILQHVIDVGKGVKRPSNTKKKTLGKSQPRLCSAIGKYLQETMQLESTCSDLALEIYQLTKDEAVIVNAMITVICRIGTDEHPVERLLNALKYFDFTQRFLSELEERLFRNTKERPAIELALKYVNLYLKAVSLQATLSAEYENPARLLLAKILYHFDRDMPPLVIELLRHFPTVLPHREQRDYDHSDPLITVIKHLLMGRTYDMQDPDGAERLLLSKLRFEYHFQPFEPTKQQVLDNLVEKLKAGRLEQLGYAFALFCRRSSHLKVLDSVLGKHLMPLATSYCDLAAQNKSYDARLVSLLQCISLVLKPLPLDTDISAFVGFLKRLLVAVPRSEVQLPAVQACLRLQRFGFTYTLDALKDFRPSYQMDPLTRAMFRCFAERKKQFRQVAATKKASKD